MNYSKHYKSNKQSGSLFELIFKTLRVSKVVQTCFCLYNEPISNDIVMNKHAQFDLFISSASSVT